MQLLLGKLVILKEGGLRKVMEVPQMGEPFYVPTFEPGFSVK
jgi:hypothetical protein